MVQRGFNVRLKLGQGVLGPSQLSTDQPRPRFTTLANIALAV